MPREQDFGEHCHGPFTFLSASFLGMPEQATLSQHYVAISQAFAKLTLRMHCQASLRLQRFAALRGCTFSEGERLGQQSQGIS